LAWLQLAWLVRNLTRLLVKKGQFKTLLFIFERKGKRLCFLVFKVFKRRCDGGKKKEKDGDKGNITKPPARVFGYNKDTG